jgi:hypothetical protein
MSNDHEKLKQEEAEKSARLQELMYVKKSNKKSKLTNDLINTKIASPKRQKQKSTTKWNDEKSIEHICDYYDELQYNIEYFKSNSNDNDNLNFFDDNKSSNVSINQLYELTKMRKNILNRKLIDHRERLKCDRLALKSSDKNLITSISSIVDSLTIPTFHFHLILSLTMVLLTHQCPHYLLVL